MDRDDIIRMAREVADIQTDSRGRKEFIFDSYGIEAFANLVAAAEREACAKVCEIGTGEPVQMKTLEILRQERERIAFVIRERGAP